MNLDTKQRRQSRTCPWTATDLRGGSASFAGFFPEAKGLLAQFEEYLWNRLYVLGRIGNPLIFDDQYMCSGGGSGGSVVVLLRQEAKGQLEAVSREVFAEGAGPQPLVF